MSIIKKLANKYDPSVGGAVGMIGGFVVIGGAIGTLAFAVIGAGVGTVLGAGALAGAVWGGGIVAAGTALLAGKIFIPQIVTELCYAHEAKKHVAVGGSTYGMRYFGGIEKLSEGKPECIKLRQEFAQKFKNKKPDPKSSKSDPGFKNNL